VWVMTSAFMCLSVCFLVCGYAPELLCVYMGACKDGVPKAVDVLICLVNYLTTITD